MAPGGSVAEIYDPVANTWTEPPLTGHYFGDANSEILPDGRVLLAVLSLTDINAEDSIVIYNPANNQWQSAPSTNGGHDESAWVKLPDGSILFVDMLSLSSERYIPSLNQWVVDANVPDSLYDFFEGETGAAFLLPDGRAFFLGSPGTTAYYTPSGNVNPGSWSVGPAIPDGYGAADAPAAMMVNGKILCAFSPAPGPFTQYPQPTVYFEFNYLTNSFTQVGAPAGGLTDNISSYEATMLDLPDGTVLYAELYSSQYYIYTPDGTPLAAGKPVIGNVTSNSCDSFTITGTLFNGISEGAAYGDDWQMATNYPIVRLTAGGNVYYARTYNWNRTGVQTGLLADTAQFVSPGNLPDGTYQLVVIANGISSDPVTFTSSLPHLTSNLSPQAICTNTDFTYTPSASAGAVATWTRGAIAGISNAAVTTPQSVNPNEVLVNTGALPVDVIYSFHVVNGSCINNEQVVVEVDPLPQVDSIYPEESTILCPGYSVLLYGNQGNGIWNIGDSTGYFIQVDTPGTYFVMDSGACGAAYSNQIVITEFPPTAVSITGLSDTLCTLSPTVTLTGSPPGGYYSGSTDNILNPSNAGLGWNYIYYNYTDNNGCSYIASDSTFIEVCTGIKNTSVSLPAITLYPNPTSGMLNVKAIATVNGNYRITVTNIDGQALGLKEVNVSNGHLDTDFDMQDFASGIYFLSISSGEGTQTLKVLKF